MVGTDSGPAAALAEDLRSKTVGPLEVTLDVPAPLTVDAASAFTFQVRDPATGEPVTTLQPYLGAPAHVVILSEDGQAFAHTHGEVAASGEAVDEHGSHAADGALGPEIGFHHTFTAPGLYKIWGQFRTASGAVVTADFVVRVFR